MTGHAVTSSDLLQITTHIVVAYVSNNALPMAQVPNLIRDVQQSLASLSAGHAALAAAPKAPAVPIRKSITPDFLISLEDGRKYKSLKRHLRTSHNLSPEQYREKWGLPRDYPMVAPNYATRRSELAKSNGLGRKRATTSGGSNASARKR